MKYTHFLFDWGNTLMEDLPNQTGPMYLWPQVAAVPGALELLGTLASKGHCHIASNADSSSAIQIRRALQRVGLDQFISGVFCFKNTGLKKPDTAFFATIIKQLETSKDKVVMVGDSLENDVLGATASGIDAIWFNRYNEAIPTGVKSVATLDELLVL